MHQYTLMNGNQQRGEMMDSVKCIEGLSINEFWTMKHDSSVSHADGAITYGWRRVDGSERRLTHKFDESRNQWMLVETRY